MDQKKKLNRPPRKIETVEWSPTALIATNDGFIGSYLSQKLLELPLHLIFLSDRELEEIKHLKANKRFIQKTVEAEAILSPETFPKLDYIFQIVSSKQQQRDCSQMQQLTKKLLQIAKTNSAKFQLAITTNSDKALKSAINAHGRKIENQQKKSLENGQNSLEQTVVNFSKQHNLDARIVYIIHAYGPKMPIESDWAFARLLKTLHKQKKLVIEGEGLTSLYPVFVADVASALAKTMFSERLKGEIILVGSEKEITVINLAYKIREMLLHKTAEILEILFADSDETSHPLSERMIIKSHLIKSQENLGWNPTGNLEEGLTKTLDWLKHKPKITSLVSHKPLELRDKEIKETRKDTKVPKTKRQKKASKGKKITTTSILALITAILIPPIVFLVTLGSAAFTLRRAATQLKRTNTNHALKMSQKSTTLFKAARHQLALLSKAIPPSHKTAVEEAEAYLELGQLLGQTLQHAVKALGYGSELKDIMLSQSNNKMGLFLTKLNGELDCLYTKLSHIEVILSSDEELRLNLLTLDLDPKITQALEDIGNLRSTLNDIRKIVDLAPKIFATEGRRTYLLLLQNNAELRPTGGFIGSYALITFEKGQLLDFSVEDVYTADGQLKGHVEPPAEIKKYLGEAGWYLRDSNWDPDFPTAARKIEWFFTKETGKKLDGTIALNLYVIQEILRALGPIELPDYAETIVADNLFKTAGYYSEINSFPGSTQKRDFLAYLSKNIFFESEKANAYELVKIAAALHTSLKRGQLLIALHDSQAQQTLNDLGWDGSIKEVECKTNKQSCAKTFIAIREANLGVNKANYFIKRQIIVRQNLKAESIETILTIKYKNQSPTNKWPGGNYKNYMRIYLSEGSEVTAVNVNGKILDSSQLSLKAEHNKTVAGFLVVVPVQQESEISLVTQTGGVLFEDGKAQSNLLLQKQSGTENDPLTISLIYPENLKLTSANLPLRIENSQATLSQRFTQDLNLQVEFERAE